MSLSAFRTKLRSRGRFVLGVFVVAWLNASLQPCLMAMEVSPSGSAPISVQQDPANHADHATHRAGPPCAICPPPMSHGDGFCTVAGILNCDILPDIKQCERQLEIDLSNGCGDSASGSQYFDRHRAPPKTASVHTDSVKPTFLVGPPLRIRHCVFLK